MYGPFGMFSDVIIWPAHVMFSGQVINEQQVVDKTLNNITIKTNNYNSNLPAKELKHESQILSFLPVGTISNLIYEAHYYFNNIFSYIITNGAHVYFNQFTNHRSYDTHNLLHITSK